MNFENIAATAFSTVLPYLVKGGEEIAKGAGKDLWELIKKPFTKEKDKILIESLEQSPHDKKKQSVAEYKLTEFMEDNPMLARELESLCKRIPSSGPEKVNMLSIQGTDNTGVQDTNNSNITIIKI